MSNDNFKVLALIPARGGSKGIPGKNIKLLGEKPLIQYAIETGLNAPSITKVVVSTDDEKIAAIAKAAGAAVPFIRPAHLATDTAKSLDVVLHTVAFLKEQGEVFDAVCLLQATSPFRAVSDVENAIQIFKEQQADCLISVIPVPHEFHPNWVFMPTVDDEKQLKPSIGETIISRRQDLPPAFIRNGAIYITDTNVLTTQKSLYGEKITYYQMGTANHVNLDTMDDWKRAEELVEQL